MGARGPAPLPANVHALRGNPGKRDHQATVGSKARPSVPTMPTTLSAEGKAEWKRLVPELERLGLLTKVDRAALAGCCRAWAHACDAEKKLNSMGLTRKDRDGAIRKNPAWQIWREATTLHAQLAAQLMCTPASRLRAPAPGGDDGDGDPDQVLD